MEVSTQKVGLLGQVADTVLTIRETVLSNIRPIETLSASISTYGWAGILPRYLIVNSVYISSLLAQLQQPTAMLSPTSTIFTILSMMPGSGSQPFGGWPPGKPA